MRPAFLLSFKNQGKKVRFTSVFLPFRLWMVMRFFRANHLRLDQTSIREMIFRHGGIDFITRIEAPLAGGN
jgi:hypothetical protein